MNEPSLRPARSPPAISAISMQTATLPVGTQERTGHHAGRRQDSSRSDRRGVEHLSRCRTLRRFHQARRHPPHLRDRSCERAGRSPRPGQEKCRRPALHARRFPACRGCFAEEPFSGRRHAAEHEVDHPSGSRQHIPSRRNQSITSRVTGFVPRQNHTSTIDASDSRQESWNRSIEASK